MGPVDIAPGVGFDVRPHPHIELATVTYLFDGCILHRDSLGSTQAIVPGDVNWMVAGTGIVHSERADPETRARGTRLHGIQSWVALPLEHERTGPRFEHHARSAIPRVVRDGATLAVIAGDAYGARSPVGVLSPTLYVHAELDAGAHLPVDDAHEERAIYVVEGVVTCDGAILEPGALAILAPKAPAVVAAEGAARVMLVGGARLAGERHIDWNFVSSSKERIERAKDDWRNQRFPKVPGDETEFIPLLEPGHRELEGGARERDAPRRPHE
jgi:redox-sensitive bicupin YhaK (pirin superfamily)